MVSRKRLFPLSFPFQNGQFRPSCGQLVFLRGNGRPRVRLFLRKQGTNVFCNDAGVRFYSENNTTTQSAAMSKRISIAKTYMVNARALMAREARPVGPGGPKGPLGLGGGPKGPPYVARSATWCAKRTITARCARGGRNKE